MTNAFQTCKANFSAGTSAGIPNAVNDAEKTPASSPPQRDGAAANLLRLPAFESIITSWNLSFGWSGGGGGQLSSWRILVPMRLPQ
jgi:hypothetical protein